MFFSVKRLRLLSLLGFLLLAGCATSPAELGISQMQWESYDRAQRAQFVQSYHQIKAQQQAFKQAAVADHNTLSVNIRSGTVMMPPFTHQQAYLPVVFTIDTGQCKRIPIYQADQQQQTDLDACYQDNILYLDPSRYDVAKSKGSLLFNDIPLWKHGFTYHNVSSSGYVRLTQVDITIKRASQAVESPPADNTHQ